MYIKIFINWLHVYIYIFITYLYLYTVCVSTFTLDISNDKSTDWISYQMIYTSNQVFNPYLTIMWHLSLIKITSLYKNSHFTHDNPLSIQLYKDSLHVWCSRPFFFQYNYTKTPYIIHVADHFTFIYMCTIDVEFYS